MAAGGGTRPLGGLAESPFPRAPVHRQSGRWWDLRATRILDAMPTAIFARELRRRSPASADSHRKHPATGGVSRLTAGALTGSDQQEPVNENPPLHPPCLRSRGRLRRDPGRTGSCHRASAGIRLPTTRRGRARAAVLRLGLLVSASPRLRVARAALRVSLASARRPGSFIRCSATAPDCS